MTNYKWKMKKEGRMRVFDELLFCHRLDMLWCYV